LITNRALTGDKYNTLWSFYDKNASSYHEDAKDCVKGTVPTDTADLPQALYAIKTKNPLVKYKGLQNWFPGCFSHKLPT
jgi:hypothetical protein